MNKKLLLHKFIIALPILIYMVIHMVWFGAIEKADFSRCTEIHSFIDDMIPFCEYFIIPYLLWFLYIVFGVVYQLFSDERRFAELSAVLISGMLIFLVVSTIFPNILFLRPAEMPNDNICCRMVEKLYKIDTPTNVMPSIHVFNTLAVLASLFRSKGKAARKPVVRFLCLALSVSILLATMFLKQHSVLDVTIAILMFAVLQTIFGCAFGKEKNPDNKKAVSEKEMAAV